jgi:hypothetical protein
MAGTLDELIAAFLVVGPEVLGNKKTRKLILKMDEYLREHTPANGVGPVIAARRDAISVLLDIEQKLEKAEA